MSSEIHAGWEQLALLYVIAVGKNIPESQCLILQLYNRNTPAAVTMLVPSGFIAKYSTLIECPVNIAFFLNDGYFHTII